MTTINGFCSTPQIMNQQGADLFAKMIVGALFGSGQFNVGCFRCCGTGFEPVSPTWTASMTGNGRANVDLGDGYQLQFNEHSSEIKIINSNTGETTRVWGDPHVDYNGDGKTDFDFWGDTTFTLENGTKITIETEPWNGNQNMYVASKVIVTKGDNAIIVDGVSQNQKGDMSITQSNNGYLVDAMHNDGYTLYENGAGQGWLTGTGKLATQADLNVTRPGQAYGPGTNPPEWTPDFGAALGQFLVTGIVLAFMNAIRDTLGGVEGRPVPQPIFDSPVYTIMNQIANAQFE